MRMRRTLVTIVALWFTSAVQTAGVAVQSDPESRIDDSDSLLVDVGKSVQGFGGAYVGSDGVRYVWLTHPSDSGLLNARSVLTDRLGEEFETGTFVARRATYTFEQLDAWHDKMIEVLAIDGVVLSDIDDRTNRLTVGVISVKESEAAVTAELRRIGVPEEAVEIEETSPVRFALLNTRRPMVGGLQIQFQTGVFGLGTGTCTLGVITKRGTANGFVTNSHCSRTQGEVDNGRYWQPTRGALDGGQVGTETVDPYYDTGSHDGVSCPSGRRCRISDSNFVARHTDVTLDRGFIARPPVNSTSWNGSSKFRITKGTNPTSGTLSKVGRTTGRTAGSISGTCIRVTVSDSDITLFCQNRVSAAVDFGDSGSPVFAITNSPSTNDVSLVGVLWGLVDGEAAYFYSQWGLIKSDLGGSFSTCAPTFC
jgi:hypothetical protein